MARLLGTLNEGSLLRRTLLHVGTFVLGSLAFVTVVSLVLVTMVKAILPPPATAAAGASTSTAHAAEGKRPEYDDGEGPGKKVSPTISRPRATRTAPGEQESGASAD